jgi:hypothetical protein
MSKNEKVRVTPWSKCSPHLEMRVILVCQQTAKRFKGVWTCWVNRRGTPRSKVAMYTVV